MSEARATRVGEEIQREIARMLSTGQIKDPRIGFVTVTAVEVTPDLMEAKVFYVAHGSPAEIKDTGRALSDSAPKLRGHIGRVMKIRHAPELRFVHDKSIEEGEKIERLLKEVKDQDAATKAEQDKNG
jgi:ribosome-binding factor A